MSFKKYMAGFLLAAFASTAGFSTMAQAEEAAPDQKVPLSCGTIDHANGTYLAYIKSPNQFVNDESRSGLTALANTLIERTTVEPDAVIGCDIEKDNLSLYPFIYWPVTSGTAPLSAQAEKKIQNYLNAGGVLVVDIRDAGVQLDATCRPEILGNIVTTNDLIEPDINHSLRKSFYINTDMQGSRNFGKLCVEAVDAANKNKASSIIIGEKNWAGAWAGTMMQNKPVEREKALRAGINMVMYALNGNYKNDAIHTSSILEKLEKRRIQP